jgi:glycosyltransferase involved in cell wall biosynthesis
MDENILIDAREFNSNKLTGIGRVLCGFVGALASCDFIKKIILATPNLEGVPFELAESKKVEIKIIPERIINSEFALTKLTKMNTCLFISPYPKLPFTGSFCRTINTVHDVLYITHPAYKNKLLGYIERIRLRVALEKADLTWFVSKHTLQQTKKVIGIIGNNPRIRYSAIDNKFSYMKSDKDDLTVKKYNLEPGYVMVVGNGKTHKNLGVLLKISRCIARKIVFIGVSKDRQNYWRRLYPNEEAVWLDYVVDKELPPLMRNAFCLAQPSTAEGFGYPPLEAMACGAPAVVSSIPALRETTGGYAITADPNEPASWMESFELLEDKKFYRNKIAVGLKWVEPFRGQKGFDHHISDIEDLIRTNK